MPGRRGLTIDEQRSSSSFRFEEGRGIISGIKTRAGTTFNSEKLCVVVTIQRLGRDGKPTSDEPIDEELSYGKLAKFHPGHTRTSDDENPADLGPEGEGNCIYTVDDAYPDPKAKACVWSKSLELAGVPALLLNGYMPNLLGLDAQWTREMVKYEGLTNEKGETSEGSNLIVKKGDGNILNLGEIIKRAGGRAPAKGATPAANQTATQATALAGAENAAADSTDEADLKALELLMTFQGKTETRLAQKDIGTKLVRLLVTKKVPPKLHRGIQVKFGDKAWLHEQASALGWGVNGDEIVIPAGE